MMKKTLTLSMLLSCCYLFSQAQIPNPGFENWDNMGTYSNPTGWGTMNNTTSAATVFTAEKGTPGSAGSSYLKLTSKTTSAGVVNGIAVSGKLDSLTMQPISGFSYTLRPVSLSGKWQHMIFGTSQGSVSVTLTKWNSGSGTRDVIGSGSVTLSGMVMSWASFSVPITYALSGNPDTCIIVMKASGSTPTNNDYLWVDELSLDEAPAVVMNETVPSLGVAPNPSVNAWYIHGAMQTTARVQLTLLSALGEIVYKTEADNPLDIRIDNRQLPAGNYLLLCISGHDRQAIQLSKRTE